MRKNFITIGTFDGVHLGHRHLMFVLKDLAARSDMESMALTFPLPPRAVINGEEPQLLTTPAEKSVLLKEFGVEKVINLDFAKIRDLSACDFFDILLKKYDMGGILTGPDFAFGRGRNGDLNFLHKACAANNITCVQADFVRQCGHKISSSRIRVALHAGDIAAANALLGRAYGIAGKVVKGRQLGRTIGFPTANLDISANKVLPRGIFAARAILGAEAFNAVCNIGTRPTIENNGRPLVEAHLLDFDRDIYDQILHVDITAKIRDEIKFKSIDELTAQIQKDAASARKLLQ